MLRARQSEAGGSFDLVITHTPDNVVVYFRVISVHCIRNYRKYKRHYHPHELRQQPPAAQVRRKDVFRYFFRYSLRALLNFVSVPNCVDQRE